MRLPRFVAAVLLAVGGAALPSVLGMVGVVGDLNVAFERKALDYRTAWYRGARFEEGSSPAGVVVVAIDDASLERLGRFAVWPRAYFAHLVDSLSTAGAAAIALDVLFPEPDVLPPAALDARAQEVSGETLRVETARAVLGRMGSDRLLADAMRRSGRVVLGIGPNSDETPVPVLAEAARDLGHVAMAPDPDGILRRVRMAVRAPSGEYESLALAAVRLAREPRADAAVAEPSDSAAGSAGERVLDFLGPRGTFNTVSFSDVLAGKVPHPLLSGAIVFVGATASGLGDTFATPFGPDLPGVEAHATLAYQALNGTGVRDLSGLDFPLRLLLALAVVSGALLLGPSATALWATGVAFVYVVVCFEAFASADVHLPVVVPLQAWGLGLVLASAYRYSTEERRRRAIQKAFGRYLAPEVVDEISRRPEVLGLGGEVRELTAGFVDIRGFTTLSEKLEPEVLARFLNGFFETVGTSVQAHRGMVDKYIGDAVMMVFGAPGPSLDHSAEACTAALAIRDAVAVRATEWQALGIGPVHIGIGVESGPAVVGHFGWEGRFEYTALGDTVNVAARLQDLNKEWGTTILVGPGTRRAAGAGFRFREVGTVALRGRGEPVPAFELLGTGVPRPDHDTEDR